MLRWFSLLLVLSYCALLGVALSRRAPSPSAPPEPVPPPPEVTLTVYYEKDPLPEELYKSWATQHRIAVVQRPLAFTAGAWPADGDLYIVSPRWLASLQQQIPLRAPADGQLARAVNPAFTSQPFDADNQRAVPWRWTPWVWVVRAITSGVYERILCAADDEMLPALERKWDFSSVSKMVANGNGEFASESQGWQKFLAEQFHLAILPACYLEKAAANNDSRVIGLKLQICPWSDLRGTIIHLDLLATPADADPDRQRLADGLAQHLLAPEQQQRLVTVSGYFPVATKLRHEYDFAPVPLPKEHWFNRSGFLINRPPPVGSDPEPNAAD